METVKFDPVENPNKISNYWKRQRKLVLAIIFFGVLFNGSMSIGPILQGKLIDAIVMQFPIKDVLLDVVFFVGVILLIQIMRFFKRYYVRLFANRSKASMRMMLYNNILHRNFAELSCERTGDLMTKFITDVDICVEGMRKGTTEVFDTGIIMITYLITLFVYDWKITLGACIFIPITMWLGGRLKKTIFKYSSSARAESSKLANLTYENIENIVLLRVNGIEEKTRQKYFQELNELENKTIKANILESSMQPLYKVIALLGIVVILYYGSLNVIAGVWSLGMFSAFITIFVALSTRASSAARTFNSFQKAKASWQRIKPYLNMYQQNDKYDRGSKGNGALIIKDLSFCYPGSDKFILQHISFTAKKGNIIGITGPVACGKSSLGIALQGYYPYVGSILLDGFELKEYSEIEISRRVSYLGHKLQLFSDTIYNNITLGSDGDITAVLQDVCFEEDLKSMPDGIHTIVGNSGVRLSGGQQARIALARALYCHCPLIVLDDPFSSIDKKTEEVIIENFRSRYSDSIILLISHRLSAFVRTDNVLLIHSDGVLEIGKHSTILSSSALYASIFNIKEVEVQDEE